MKTALSLLAGLLVLVLAIISVQNPAVVTLRFLAWQTPLLPLWVVIVVALACGMLLVGLLAMPGRIVRYRTTRKLEQQLDAAQTTITSLEQGGAPLPSAPDALADGPAPGSPVAPASQPAGVWGMPSAERELPGQERSATR